MTKDATNKFDLVEDAVRTSADRISTESRRSRREFNGTVQHFALDPRVIEELNTKGHPAFVNDDGKGRLRRMEDIGYRYVTNREAYGDRKDLNPEDKVVIRYGTRDYEGTPQDIYLMIQPWEFWKEDQKAFDKANSKVDQLIQETGKEVERSIGHKVTVER